MNVSYRGGELAAPLPIAFACAACGKRCTPGEDGVAATAEPDAVLDDQGERSPREPTLDDLLSEQHWDFVRHVLNDSRAPEVRQVASAMGVRVQRAPAKADTPDVTTRQRDEKEQ